MTRSKVAIVFGNSQTFNIMAFKYFVLSVNKIQKSFEFYFPEVVEFKVPARVKDATSCLDLLTNSYLVLEPKPDYCIGIVNSKSKNDFFAYPGEKVAVITTNHWQKRFSPPSVFEYLLNSIYYCLISSQVSSQTQGGQIFNPSFFETHPMILGCIADLSIERSNNRIGVALGYICDRHRKEIIESYGEPYLEEIEFVLNRKWMGSLIDRNSVLYSMKHYFKFDINRDSGLNKTIWEKVKSKFYEIPGTLTVEILKVIFLALLTLFAGILGWDSIKEKILNKPQVENSK